MGDLQLIQEYAGSRSNDAFKSLIDQYVGLVYSACLRQSKDRHLAEDATQAVFLLLSQKAGGFNQPYLSGWLLTASRYACANIRRQEQRRQRREQVVAMNQHTATETLDQDLLDLLDEALCKLKAGDREALVLRYLKEQPMGDVAQKLGVSPHAARKRVERAVEKLRLYFSRRGILTNSSALCVILTQQLPGVALTPAVREGITLGILQVCHAGWQCTAASVAIAKGTKTMMLLPKLKTVAAIAILAATAGTTGWMISRAVADNSPGLQSNVTLTSPAAAPPKSAAVATVPTTPPANNLSTPEKTYASIIAALKAGDRDELYQCLAVDPKREPLLIDRALEWDLAYNRVMSAAKDAYGPEADSLPQHITIEKVMEMMAATGQPARTIGDDSAEFSTQVPAAFLAMLPPETRELVSQWSGAPLRFKKQAGNWKFDIDRSMRVEMHNGAPAPTEAEESQREGKLLQEMADGINRVAEKIPVGDFPTAADAGRALQQAHRQLLSHNGLRDGVNMTVLPAKG